MKKKLATGLTASAIVGTTLAVTPAEAATIKVKSGDSLWKLAQTYNTSVAALTSANHLSTTVLSIGQTLTIPGKEIQHFFIYFKLNNQEERKFCLHSEKRRFTLADRK